MAHQILTITVLPGRLTRYSPSQFCQGGSPDTHHHSSAKVAHQILTKFFFCPGGSLDTHSSALVVHQILTEFVLPGWFNRYSLSLFSPGGSQDTESVLPRWFTRYRVCSAQVVHQVPSLFCLGGSPDTESVLPRWLTRYSPSLFCPGGSSDAETGSCCLAVAAAQPR